MLLLLFGFVSMFEFVWFWVFVFVLLFWLLCLVLLVVDSGEVVFKVSFFDEFESFVGCCVCVCLLVWWQQVCFVLFWFFLLFVVVCLQWVGDFLLLFVSGCDLLFVVDVFGFMDYCDMCWQDDEISCLELIKKFFGDFIEDCCGDCVGLILFGSQVYLQVLLIFDWYIVWVWLDEVQIGIVGKNIVIGDVIGLVVKCLCQWFVESWVLVLIIDGVNIGGQIVLQIVV